MSFYLFVLVVLKGFCMILPIFVSVAFLTLFESKVMAVMQRRRGPNVVGFLGLLQPFADALKLVGKETIMPCYSNIWIFVFSPVLALTLALMAWAVVPFQSGLVLVDLQFSVLYIFIMSSLVVYSMMMAGYASSKSKYSFLGALRSVAQMISYEISVSLIVLSVVICAGSFNFSEIVFAQRDIFFCVPLFPFFVMFYISVLAETNRPPFDLPEAENELVAGYFVEYGGVGFALFFMAEASNIILMSFLTSIYFLGGWCMPFFFMPSVLWLSFKAIMFCFLFVWVRASLPRYRYDQLMFLGWKVFLPVSFALVFLLISLLYFLDGFVYSGLFIV